MENMIAAVTCDIQGSSKYSTEVRRKINQILRDTFNSLYDIHRDAIHTPASFSVIKGDEFQFVLSKPERAYEVVLFYRTLAALEELKPILVFRTSIGIGEIAVENKASSYSQDGQAFHLSRRGMNNFINKKDVEKRRTIIVTGDENLNENISIILMYQDLFESRWTKEQLEAVRWRMEKLSYKEIAEKVGVAWQSVQKRLNAAHWNQFDKGLKFIGKLIQTHLNGGAS